jgi:hypothetical protein
MALFWTDSVIVGCSNVEAAKQWWIAVFDCKQVKLPGWDNPLPSDVALKLSGADAANILLCDRSEVEKAGIQMPDRPIIFCDKLQKVYDYLVGKGASPGPVQDGGDTQFFEVRDPEGNVIEICKEP